MTKIEQIEQQITKIGRKLSIMSARGISEKAQAILKNEYTALVNELAAEEKKAASSQRVEEIDWLLDCVAKADKLSANERTLKAALETERKELTEKEIKTMDNQNIGTSLIENIEIANFAQTLTKISEYHALLKTHLTEGHDYGSIPGTSKPVLLKPGAEKILMLMGLTSEFDIVDSVKDFEAGIIQYQIKCKLYKNGTLVAEGLAACNTKEKKYAKANPYDLDNTVLKMAKKRALVDAALLVGSLSQIFAQDIESTGATPQPQTATQQPAPAPGAAISEAQRRRMFAISNGNADLCREVCAKYGYKHSKDIKKADYDDICAEIAAQVKTA